MDFWAEGLGIVYTFNALAVYANNNDKLITAYPTSATTCYVPPMSDYKRVIRVFPDLGHRWPLWESAGAVTVTPSELGLSAELESRMRTWHDFWEIHHHWERGWDSGENEILSWKEGSGMIAQLREEVGSFAEIIDRRIPPQGVDTDE
jgi:hypothetical protein